MAYMKTEKVESFVEKTLDDYYNYYPLEIFEGLKIDVYHQSFGRTYVRIEGQYSTVDKYISKYDDIKSVVSQFVIDSYQSITDAYYHKDHETKMSFDLEIYCDNKLVNELHSDNPQEVKNEYLKIIFAKDKRGIKTKIQYMPYSFDVKVFQYFTPQNSGILKSYKYVYRFYNMNY